MTAERRRRHRIDVAVRIFESLLNANDPPDIPDHIDTVIEHACATAYAIEQIMDQLASTETTADANNPQHPSGTLDQ